MGLFTNRKKKNETELQTAEKNERREESLHAAALLYRLTAEAEIADIKMEEKRPLDYSDDNFLMKLWKKQIQNPLRQRDTENLSETKKAVENETDRLRKRATTDGLDLSAAESAAALKAAADEFFRDDPFGLRRMSFALQLSIDSSVTFSFGELSERALSEVLFGDENRITKLYEELEENYIDIMKEPLSDAQAGMIFGIGMTLALPALLVPVGLAAGAAAGAIGSALQITGAALLSSALFIGVTAGGVAVTEALKEEQSKKALRSLTANDVALLFAIKTTLMQESSKVMKNSEFKDALDECLRALGDLRSDAEYMLIVERTDAKETRKKIDVCNRAVQRMATIVGI